MKYQNGNIWDLAQEVDGWVVVATNTIVKRNGEAVMGGGIAKQAADLFPSLPRALGIHITLHGDSLYVHRPCICLPTKYDWRNPSTLDLIEYGCDNLIKYIVDDGRPILLPRLGCGLGGLNWEKEVRPLMDSILRDDKFILVSQ